MQICKKILQKYAYGIIPLLTTFLLNDVVYWGAMALCRNWHHYDFTTELDRMIPFVPEFVSVYFLCYLFWIVNYILAAGNGKEFFYRFLTADMSARCICFLFFVLLPTTNVRPTTDGNGIWICLMEWLYRMDEPVNLFPSIHCMNSWFCYIAVRGRKDVSKWYQHFSFWAAIAVAASTVFTKQHYLLDIAGGFLLAELVWQLNRKCNYYKNVRKVFEKINGNLSKKLVKL